MCAEENQASISEGCFLDWDGRMGKCRRDFGHDPLPCRCVGYFERGNKKGLKMRKGEKGAAARGGWREAGAEYSWREELNTHARDGQTICF